MILVHREASGILELLIDCMQNDILIDRSSRNYFIRVESSIYKIVVSYTTYIKQEDNRRNQFDGETNKPEELQVLANVHLNSRSSIRHLRKEIRISYKKINNILINDLIR